MNKVDHNLSQVMNLALTAENNEKEKQHFDLPGYIEKGQSLGLDERLVITQETEESIRKIRNTSFYGAFGPDKIPPRHPTNDLEIIKRNIPTDMSPAGRELFTYLQDCELSYQSANKNRKGFLHKKAKTTSFPTVKKELNYLANLPDSALDHFFEEFINGFLRVKTLEEELEDEKVLENKIKETEINNYINYIRGFI